MTWLLLFLSISTVFTLDQCREYRTQVDCIKSTDTQCIWDSGYCEFTKNLELGCLRFLNKIACLKQLSYPSGEMAKCIFDVECQPVQDSSLLNCDDEISKHACLSVNNTQQLCFWEPKTYTCNQVTDNTYQTDFGDLLYSASVCSRITDYLIIHSSLLWPIIDYAPDFSAEAQDIYRTDLGLQKLTADKNYDTGDLANNCIYKLCDDSNSASYFKWYQLNNAQSYELKYLKLSDRQREGCIALQISNDDDYNLIFQNKIESIGVNLIYCRYQGGIFTNYHCIYYDNELILRDSNYLTQNQVQCTQLSLYQCSYVQLNCLPVIKDNLNEQQITCVSSMIELQRLQGCQSSVQVYQTYKDCSQVVDAGQGKYLDLSQNPPECSVECFTKIQNSCNLENCQYVLNQSQDDFYTCVPKYGCNQPGINKFYCMYLAMPCQWDDIQERCNIVQEYELNLILCNDVKSKFLCGSIKTMGEECIWIDEDEICLNVLTVGTLKQFTAFPPKYLVNRNLCMNYSGNHQYSKFKCISYSTNGSCQTEDTTQFNKQLCLTTKGCFWDVMNQICQPFTIKPTCPEMISVSPDACAQFSNCVYDLTSNNCIVQSSNISCDSPGLSQSKCLSLNDQPCQWSNGKCQQITQFKEYCTSYRNVTKLVCSMQTTQKCYFVNNNCQFLDVQPNDCLDTYNRYSCQYSKGQCFFFDNKCQDFGTQQLKCEGYYLSESACQQLNTFGEKCIWQNSECQYIQQKINCLSNYEINKFGCLSIEADISAYLDKQFYCEYVNNQCVSKQDDIIGCGGGSQINRQRCSGYTNGNCLYQNYQCNTIDDTHIYWYIKLGQINCEQANRNTCFKVRGRLCQWIDQTWAGDQDKRCGQVTVSNIPCNPADRTPPVVGILYDILKFFTMTTYNAQICANLVYVSSYERCLRNDNNNECIAILNPVVTPPVTPSPIVYYPCNKLGINVVVCIIQTYGQCAFVDNLCIDISEQSADVDCSTLNQWACINASNYCSLVSGYSITDDMTTPGLVLTSSVCQSFSIATSSTCTNINFAYNQQSWSVCAAIDGCYGQLKQCVALAIGATPLTKCDSPGVSSSVCLNSSMLCQFRDAKCKNISQNQCEFELTLADCVQNQYYNCVYQNGICYTQNQQKQCDQYDNTNFLFCRQFSNCKYDYDNFKCVDLNVYIDIQNNQIDYGTQTCNQYLNQFDCLVQWRTICQFANTCQIPSTLPTTCPHLQQYSKMMCQQFENCAFKFSYFCIDTTITITCSDLNQYQCLQDIDNSLQCYWDGSNCQAVTTQTCTNVQTYQMNYSGCLKVGNQDNKKCFYQNSSKKCKILKEVNSCSNYTTNIECALRANASCLLGNPASATTTCTTSTTYNINLNQYGCAQLTGAAYYYDIYTYTCLPINLTKIQGCQNLNRVACTQSTSDALIIKCGWINNQCQQLRDLTSITDCTILNKVACTNIEITTLTCEWNVAAKTCSASAQTACYVPGSIPTSPTTLYSLSLCNKAGNTNGCMANYNHSGCITFSYTIELCSGMGLNKKACIQQTTGYCKWQNNQCQVSQLDNLNCNSDVNQNTCLMINSQMCQWNSSTYACSDKILTQCSDATNYNQCMNVPNQQCQFIDTCQELDTTPIICKSGYNLISCKNVQGQICQFKNNTCSPISYFDYWKICSNYITSDTCVTTNCEWVNSKCIKKTQCQVIDTSLVVDSDLPNIFKPCDNLYPAACVQIFNKQACMDYNLLCQWDDSLGCQAFYTYLDKIVCDGVLKVNQKVCDKYAPTFCEFQIDTCSPKISDYYFSNYPSQTLANSEINHDIDSLSCDQYTNEQDCLWSTYQACFWDVTCQSTVNNVVSDVSTLNLIGCREQKLQWRQRKCLSTSFLFQPINQIDSVQTCNTKFISQATCLSIQTEACTFDATLNLCQQTTSFDNPCSSYVLVNKKTCQSLTGYPCSYNPVSFSCISPNDSISDLSAISRKACTSLDIPVYWNNECISALTLVCDSGYSSSPKACSYAQTPCVFDKTQGYCTSIYNINSLTCDSPGVSQSTCTQIIREPCIYSNYQCKKIPSNYTCNQAKIVNEIACASLQAACSYDSISQSCQPVTQAQKCSTSGLSQSACLLNQSCQFNVDFYKCECSITANSIFCQTLSQKECSQNSNCLYNTNQKLCRRKLCEDLAVNQCVGSLQEKQCYVNGLYCQSASRCEDIINVNSTICQQIFFDGIPCIGTGKRCFTWNNYQEYCPNSNCSSIYCRLNTQNVCVPKQCSELSDCNEFGNKCVKLNDGSCIENSSCYLLEQESCNSAVVNTQASCLLQKYNIYLDDLVCTSQVCELYGISDLCNGNQYNQYTCLLQDQKCLPCEQISDGCTCAEAIGICLWQNDNCVSFQCSALLTSQSCNQIARCLWSNSSATCLLHCNKIINQEDCNLRTGECYYDSAINFCKAGVYESPNLSITIDVVESYNTLLLGSLILMVVF